MHPKAKSGTTLSGSNTNKAGSEARGVDTDVQWVKGVGPRLASVFRSRGIATVRDLLTFFPRAYEDRTRLRTVTEAPADAPVSLALTISGSRKIPMRSRGTSMLEVRCTDSDGKPVFLKYFRAPKGIESRFQPGARVVATGKIKLYQGRPEIVHPELNWSPQAPGALPQKTLTPSAPQTPGPIEPPLPDAHVGRVVPIYTEIEGVPTRMLRKILWEALEKYGSQLTEDVPPEILSRHGLPRASEAVRAIHFPEAGPEAAQETIQALLDFRTPAHARLIYEEFFKFEYLVLRNKLRREKEQALPIGLDGGRKAVADLRALLPFQLTGDQTRVVEEILGDLEKPQPMNRLIQGDVGSGKTAVAFLSAGAALAEGGQVALMAPTEILAEQHYKNAVKLFGGRLRVALLTGKTPQSERVRLFGRLAAGEPVLLIGTHALLEDPVVFSNLVLVMIDEQHRFGVEQRRVLRRKGTREVPSLALGQGRGAPVLVQPHFLVLTATPIPRTLALTAYGDLAVSTVREMPPGRSPVVTEVVRGDQRLKAYEKVREQLRQGRQAYFIYPLVKESEAEGFTELRSAVVEADRLAKEVYPEFKVGLLHGQMKPEDKADIMDRFSRGELHLLVSTTVIEVGVDVPNSTIICIDHAERFGLSQLHQLRGRVGRGKHSSFCFLFTRKNASEITDLRLDVLEKTTDGFQIAEADLELRGPGEFLGVRQSGSLPFRMASLIRDRGWLEKARDDAAQLLAQDAALELPQHRNLKVYFTREGQLQSDRLKTS
jgi:ATP-dependent DNA helicase RecG